MKKWQGSDVKWEVVLFLRTLATLCSVLTTAAVVPSVPFRSAAQPAVLARAWCSGGFLPWPTSGRRLAGIGELLESFEDYVMLGHDGRPESGLE